MAIWKDTATARKETVPEPTPRTDFAPPRPEPKAIDPVRQSVPRDARESLIAHELTIEGKIEGAGHVRIAGRFKGDVHVQGNLAVENGAKVTGAVRAGTVTIGGEVEGNIESASQVELLETGVLNGDLKAASLTVAAGSRMRGQVEFGWSESAPKAVIAPKAASSSAA